MEDILPALLRDGRKRQIQVIWIHRLHFFMSWRPKNVDDLGNLIGSVFAGKQYAVVDQFGHDAASGPNVYFESVVLTSENQLDRDTHVGVIGTSVVSGADVEDAAFAILEPL